jgi:hypothetical protein
VTDLAEMSEAGLRSMKAAADTAHAVLCAAEKRGIELEAELFEVDPDVWEFALRKPAVAVARVAG